MDSLTGHLACMYGAAPVLAVEVLVSASLLAGLFLWTVCKANQQGHAAVVPRGGLGAKAIQGHNGLTSCCNAVHPDQGPSTPAVIPPIENSAFHHCPKWRKNVTEVLQGNGGYLREIRLEAKAISKT